MRPAHKFLLGVGVVLVLGAALLIDTTWLARIAEKRLAAATGRAVHIDDIRLRPGRCLHIAVDGIRVGNPDWAQAPELINSRTISGCAAWLPLLAGRFQFDEAKIDATRVALERDGERATWQLDRTDSGGQNRLSVRHLNVVDSSAYFRDADEGTDLDIDIAGGVGAGDELHLEATGRFRRAPVHLSVITPAVLPSAESPTRISAEAEMGRTTAAATGYLKKLALDGIDVTLFLAGDDLSELNRLGINLPATPPYKLHGRLASAGDTWHLSSLKGHIGDSDINGALTYTRSSPRPLLRADVFASLLDFDDLGPLVGAPPKTQAGETASAQQKAQAQAIAARGRVLPTRPLGIERWPRMDADVHFRADRIRRPNAVPIDKLRTHLLIDDATLRLQPLEFEMAGGRVVSNVVLEGKAQPPRGALSATVENIDLAQLLPNVDQEQAAAGRLFGSVNLESVGNSIATLAAQSNGEVTLMVNGGHMSALLLEMAGLDAGESLLILLTRGNKPVPLRCAIADFNLEDGRATPELAVVDTADTVFILDGSVTMTDEALDLTLTPQPKDRSLPVVRSPLTIQGHFNDTAVKPEAVPLLARGGAALALGLVNPLLAIIPLIETGPGEDSDCAAFARRVQGESVTTQLTNGSVQPNETL